MPGVSRRWLFAGVLLLALVISLVWFFGVGTHRMMSFPRPFSSELWKEAKEGAVDGSDDVRCRMVLDLRVRVGLVGRSQADVIGMLGDEREDQRQRPDHYILCPSFGDYYVLELRWANGRVTGSRVYQS